ncbi:MAG: DUF58 domain-containing protein [Thiovulaceae bacterium]|nr:DUF58 domain-containing protein [Sulfurimonadaceae bacterium]
MGALKQILVRARRQVFSEMVGNNPSIFHGEGYDFIELREYQQGDDIKHIDWNITAKMQKPYVKVFREERELNVALVSMMGGSLHFGSTKLKQETLSEIIATLSFSVIKNGDLLSHFLFQETLQATVTSSKRQRAVHDSVEQVLSCDVIGHQANYKDLGATLMKQVKRKSLIIIVGDFFEIPDFKVLAKKHEIIAIIVRDKLEEQPPAMGFSALLDPQDGDELEGDFSRSKVDAYAKKVHEHDHALYEALRKSQVRFAKIYTHENPYVSLRRVFGAL